MFNKYMAQRTSRPIPALMIRICPTISRNTWRLNKCPVQQVQTRPVTIKHGGSRGRQKGIPNYWSAEKLATDERYPLSFAMRDVAHPDMEDKVRRRRRALQGQSYNSGGAHVRAQIVSPDLCDDILKYAGKTLDKHKGCDILDIMPGNGLWSQKLHEYLQPRSHVLLEPRFERYERFLGPLLNAPGSKYSLVEKDPTELQTYRDMVTEKAFPHQTVRNSQDPMAQQQNDTLLVTGSLVWDPPLLGMGLDSMGKQLYYHFNSAARANDLFHSFGLVRTLLWMKVEDLSPTLADSISGLQKTNCFMQMSQNVDLIVNAERSPRKSGKGSSSREPQYEVESTIRALQRGKRLGMELPEHRRDHIHKFAADIEQMSNGTGIVDNLEIQRYLHDQHLAGMPTTGLLAEGLVEHYDAEKAIRTQYPEVDIGPGILMDVRTSRRKVRGDHPAKDQIRKYIKDCANVNLTLRRKKEIEQLANIGEAMYRLECKILGMQDGPEKDAAMEELEKLDASWEAGHEKLPSNYTRAPGTELDDRLGLRAPPSPRVQWDNRSFEPLTMRMNEAWPTNRLSLISTESVPQPTDRFPEYFEWLGDFISGLYGMSADSVPEALDKMQHGLASIIDDCPSLKDPAKGGRLQMKHFRVRLLTSEMIEELLEAYKNWPFKAPGSDHNKYFRNRNSAQNFSGKPGPD